MTSRLSERTVVVTGASSGIGLATAEALIAGGAWVAMVARTEARLVREAERIGGVAVAADVSTEEGAERVASEVLGRLGTGPDVLVNAAGSFAMASFDETDPAEFDRQLRGNLRAPFLMTRAILPSMRARGGGHIIDVGSIAGRLPLPGNAAYGAAKFGLHGLHEVLAAELTGSGIRTTLVEPAATDTPLWDPVDPDTREDLPSRIRMLGPEDVARAIVYCITQPPGVEVSHLAIRAVS